MTNVKLQRKRPMLRRMKRRCVDPYFAELTSPM